MRRNDFHSKYEDIFETLLAICYRFMPFSVLNLA
jgi:hypothetical protein